MLCFGCLAAGLAADRFGASVTFIVGSLLLAASSWAFYHLAGTHPEQLFLLYGVVGLCGRRWRRTVRDGPRLSAGGTLHRNLFLL